MRRPPPPDRGSILAAVMAAIAVAAIFSAVAVQEWADVLRRDKEAEMIFRGEEIARALRRYRRDRGALPTEFKQLTEPGSKGQYFIRQPYKDPLVPDGKWGFLYAGPGGGVVDPNLADVADSSTMLGVSSDDPNALQRPGLEKVAGTDEFAGGSTLAGLPLAGVRSLATGTPFRHYREKDQYSEWQFTVFDLDAPQGNAPGQPGQPGQPGRPGGVGRPGGRPGGGPGASGAREP